MTIIIILKMLFTIHKQTFLPSSFIKTKVYIHGYTNSQLAYDVVLTGMLLLYRYKDNQMTGGNKRI